MATAAAPSIVPPLARAILAGCWLAVVSSSPALASLTGAWSKNGGANETVYGHTVHTAGDVNGDGFADVIIGAPGVSSQQSFAYVHHGSAAGLAFAPNWTKSNGTNDRFGQHVATAGDVNNDGYDDVVVCTTAYTNGQQGEGRVQLFLGSASGLASTPAWSWESNLALAQLRAAAYAGDVNGDGFDDLVIGCGGAHSNAGRVWIYLGNATASPTLAWTVQGAPGAGVGHAVSTAGDLNADGYDDVLVGAYLGSFAWVVLGSAAGPTSVSPVVAPTPVVNSRFGASVSTAGDTNGDGYCDFVVGAPHDSTDDWHEGRVYLYFGSASGFQTAPVWSAESNVVNSELGSSVACGGDINGDGYGDVLAAAPNLTNGDNFEGRVMAFYGGFAAGLAATPFWIADGEASPGLLGRGLCTAGDVNGDGYSDVIAGAPAYEEGSFFDEGRVAVWHGGPDALSYVVHPTEANQAVARYGTSVALGDFDADGYAEQVVGAPRWDTGGVTDVGRVWIYRGKPGAPQTVPTVSFSYQLRSDQFGFDVANAHDVNGDGYDDLIVGGPQTEHPSGDRLGAAHVFLGSASGITVASWTTWGASPFSQCGHSVSGAGDVNGDGYADVIVGSPTEDGGGVARGAVSVYLGGPAGLATTPVWTWEGDVDEALFGWDVAAVGDVNRDGFGDIAIGAPSYAPDAGTQGAAYVFFGDANGISSMPPWEFLGPAGSETGYCVGGGDWNGDGFSDVAVGAPAHDGVAADGGRAQIFPSDGAGLSSTAWLTVTGVQVGARMGTVVDAADFDLDGTDELITSQPYVWNGQEQEGQVLVYQTTPLAFFWGADGNAPIAWHGIAVDSRGDVNGDGYPDIVSGSPGRENPDFQEGMAFTWLGNGGGVINMTPGPGLDRRPRLLLADDSRSIGLLGRGDGTDRVRVRSQGRSPMGRDHVALEVEAKKYGTAFNGQGTFLTPMMDTGAPGASGSWVELSQAAVGLQLTELYRWRARHVSDHPYFGAPWFYEAGNALEEFDFRPGGTATAVLEPQMAATGTLALASRPVPFRSTTTIEFEMPRRGAVELSVVDVTGRRVARLLGGVQDAGRHAVAWDGRAADGQLVAAGVYFAIVDADGQREATRLVLLK